LDGVSWTLVPEGSGLFATSRDFNLTGNPATSGDSPLLLITTSSSFNNLTASDEFGLLTSSSFSVPELGTETVSFDSSDNLWNESYFGDLNSGTPSFTLLAIPEPSTYAALAGFCALGWVMLRRRRG
jgi:hypothetical protein